MWIVIVASRGFSCAAAEAIESAANARVARGRRGTLLGLGEAHYRLNNEPAAVQTWQAVLQLPETPSTYPAWRNVAAARVRDGDLTGAIEAYREADKRAPREDKAEIANRLGWLTKETGDTRRLEAVLRQGPRRRAADHDDAGDHRDDRDRVADGDVHDPGSAGDRASTTGSSSTSRRSRPASTGACGR